MTAEYATIHDLGWILEVAKIHAELYYSRTEKTVACFIYNCQSGMLYWYKSKGIKNVL